MYASGLWKETRVHKDQQALQTPESSYCADSTHCTTLMYPS